MATLRVPKLRVPKLRAGQDGLSDRQLTLAWQSASLLLGYPDEELLARVPMLRDATSTLPDSVADPMSAFLDHLEVTPLPQLAADFVATFDHQKRCCFYLTYFQHGDTRNRGLALLRFKTAYRESGMILSDDELPDHLCVVLEFGATGDVAGAKMLLLEHRAGLELLRLALEDAHSPWALVLQSVSATLPPLAGDDREAVMKLAAQGPPAEEVGLAPFAPPEYMPQSPSGGGGGPVSLPTPTFAAANIKNSAAANIKNSAAANMRRSANRGARG